MTIGHGFSSVLLHDDTADNGTCQTDHGEDRKQQLAAEFAVRFFLCFFHIHGNALAHLHGTTVTPGNGIFIQFIGFHGELVPVMGQAEI